MEKLFYVVKCILSDLNKLLPNDARVNQRSILFEKNPKHHASRFRRLAILIES